VLITDLSLTAVEQQANHNLQRMLLLLGGALLLGAALLGVTMERSVIQPLSQLTQVIRDFDRGNLRRRVRLPPGGDEVGELARTFNHLADGVSEKAHLEQQLRQRTAELENLYTALQEKEALRAQLLKRTITAQEEERARLSRELHDEIGQVLTAVQLGLDRLARTLAAGDTATREQLARVQTLITQALTDLRHVVAALRPGVLDPLGLVPALGWVADHTLRPLGLQVTMETSGLSGRLPGELEVILFRIAQEAMNNVARHSQASHLLIRLAQTNGQVTMTLADDGVGFDPALVTAVPEQSRGVGLASMQERAALAGGQVLIESAPGRGTQIQAIVPVPPRPAQAAAAEEPVP
jgi:signal transduction histidine kinase